MKKAIIGLSLLAVMFTVLLSCEESFLTIPVVPGRDGGRSSIADAPDGLIATHGERRSITLSWEPKPDAVLYYIYRADSPLETFKRCGETEANQFKFTVTPGSTVYYKVSAVSHDGTESSQSNFVKGTSLAQPIITDITDTTESSAVVTWYMGNAANDTYKNNLLYTIYCYNGSTEVAQLSLNGSELVENKARFENLSPNTRYEYQIEAYLRSDQGSIEKSEKVDAATARRMRPGKPDKLKAARGTAKDKIELSFELPDLVDIPLGDNQYESKPVYFKIYKRRYSESGTNEYQIVCSYFGINAETPADKINGYVSGKAVTWTDNNVSRGEDYEYQVQSYADETTKILTSDSSKESAVGWALSEGTLLPGSVSYTLNQYETLYISAQLPLGFSFDPKEITYGYTLVETIEPIDDEEENNPDGVIERESNTLTYNEITNYVAHMDLTQKTGVNTPGRGVYSYKVNIKLNDETIDTVEAFSKKEVSENTDPIVVEGFEVQDGYKDKFVLKWNYRGNRRYILYVSDDRDIWTEIRIENPGSPDNDNFSYTHTAGVMPGLTKYFAIRPYRDIGGGTFKSGQMEYAAAASLTLGTPTVSLSGSGPSYSNITVAWPAAQKADTYRIRYWYTGEGRGTAKTAATIGKSSLHIDGINRLNYTFSPFENNIADVTKAGLDIQVEVDALNETLRAEVGGGEIATTSNDVTTRLVGPALLNPQASRAAAATDITVSWDRITGASGYYIFRRQFNMNNSAEQGSEAIKYYVPQASSDNSNITITGKSIKTDASNTRDDTNQVKARASFAGSRYTFTDLYMNDGEYDGSYKGGSNGYIDPYRNQQNDMAQGYSYRYYIVPVITEDLSSIEFTYNTNISSHTIREGSRTVSYSGAAALEKEGFAIGFGQDVTASKGTGTSGGNVNDRIRVTWELPAKLRDLPGFTPRYTVYSRISGAAAWATITSNVEAFQYVDNPESNGITYEYLVGISNGNTTSTKPGDSYRFIAKCNTSLDEKGRPNYLGFKLGLVSMNSVSRDARQVGSEFAEEVMWRSAGIKPYSDNNGSEHWGVDGYTIFLLNRNINNGRQWITVTDVPAGDLPNQTDQSFTVANDASNRLKVLRDYRHYYKIRSYVLNNGEKVYCPDPAPDNPAYNHGNGAHGLGPSYVWADGAENEYVKWGARQVSTNEFAAITALSIGTALNWQGSNSGDAQDKGTSGVSFSNQVPLGYSRNMDFSNSRPYFVTISGRLHGRSEAINKTPAKYGAYGSTLGGLSGSNSDQDSRLTVTGPGDVNGMYSGGVYIRGLDSGAGTGPYKVTYNGQTDYAVGYQHYRTCFTFNQNSNQFKTTRDFDWSPSGGIASTSPGRYWYALSSNRAGWD